MASDYNPLDDLPVQIRRGIASPVPSHFSIVTGSPSPTLVHNQHHHFRIIPSFCRVLCSVISGKFRHSHFIISSVFPGCSDVFRPLCSIISGYCRHSYFIIIFIFSGLFRRFSVFYVPSFPEIPVIHMSSLFHHFRMVPSLSSIISGNLRHSYFIMSRVLPWFCVFYVPSFPDYSVVFQSFMFRTWYFIMSGLFRRFSVFNVHFRKFPSSTFQRYFIIS